MKPLTLFGMVLATKNSLTAKHLHLQKATKQTHALTRTPMLNGENKMTDTTTGNRTTKSTSKNITKRERNNRVYAIYAALP